MTEQFEISFNNMMERLVEWLNTIIVNLPNMIIAILVFGVTFWLAGVTKKLVFRYLTNVFQQKSIRALVANMVALIITASGFLLALGVLNLDTLLKSLLAGAGVAGLAIGLALQGTLSNTFSGISLALKSSFNVGDFVETSNFSGTVEDIALNYTKIRTIDNNTVIIPNKQILENPIKNFSLTKQIRVIIDCGIDYTADLSEVKYLTLEALKLIIPAEDRHTLEFYFVNFGDSAINFQVRYFINGDKNISVLAAKSEGIMCIKRTFDEHGINIPYPTRTIQLGKNNPEAQNITKDIPPNKRNQRRRLNGNRAKSVSKIHKLDSK